MWSYLCLVPLGIVSLSGRRYRIPRKIAGACVPAHRDPINNRPTKSTAGMDRKHYISGDNGALLLTQLCTVGQLNESETKTDEELKALHCSAVRWSRVVRWT